MSKIPFAKLSIQGYDKSLLLKTLPSLPDYIFFLKIKTMQTKASIFGICNKCNYVMFKLFILFPQQNPRDLTLM